MQSAPTSDALISNALTQFSALPLPAAVLSNSSASGSNPFTDTLDVDSTGMATQVDLLHMAPNDRIQALSQRVASAWIHAAVALQPPSAYAGPIPVTGLWDFPSASPLQQTPASSVTVRFEPASVSPGKLQLRDTAGCSSCCAGTKGVGVAQLCPEIASAGMMNCINTTVTVSADGWSITATAMSAATLSSLADTYTTVVLMAGGASSECALVTTTSNMSVATAGILIARPHAQTAVQVAVDPARSNAHVRKPRHRQGPSTARLQNSSGLFATPPMGWNAWNAFHCDVSERLIIAQADAMVKSGLAAAGYQYLNLDDCWMVARGPDGSTTPDPVRFPSGIRAVTDYVHRLGLKFGIYQAPAATTPQGRPGLLGHEAQDVATFCEWGVDYIKLDSRGSTREGWQKVRDAINNCTQQPMYLQVSFCKTVADCEQNGVDWMEKIANSARTSGDSQANWASVLSNLESVAGMWPLAGPTGPIGGHWNDPDLLEVGETGGLNMVEGKTQIALWSFVNAPLLLSFDLRTLLLPAQAELVTLLTNRGILALNQDPLGYQGRKIKSASKVVMVASDGTEKRPTPSVSSLPGIAVEPCANSSRGHAEGTAVDAQLQQWVFNANGTLVHVASGFELTIPGCMSRKTPGDGVFLTIAPLTNATDENNCGGRNQQWAVDANRTITSRMDGACLDVFHGTNSVQSHFCVENPKGGSGPPTSEAWKVAPDLAAYDQKRRQNRLYRRVQRSSDLQTVTIRWGDTSGYDYCLQPAVPGPSPPPSPSPPRGVATEVWQKQLANGDVALLLLNKGAADANGDRTTLGSIANSAVNISVKFADVPGLMNATASVLAKDVWASADPGIVEHGSLVREVAFHSAAVLRLSKV